MKRAGKLTALVAGSTLAVGAFAAPVWAAGFSGAPGQVDQPGYHQVMNRDSHSAVGGGIMQRDRDHLRDGTGTRTPDQTRDHLRDGTGIRTPDQTRDQLRDGSCRI